MLSGEGMVRDVDGRVGYVATVEQLHLVIAWYSRAIYLEQQSETPDEGRIEQLLAERRECILDRRSLDEADADEIERVARVYTDRFHRLSDR